MSKPYFRKVRRRYRMVPALILAAAGFFWGPVRAAPLEVLVVTGANNAVHDEVAAAMRSALGDAEGRRLTLRFRTVTEVPPVPRKPASPVLVVTIGTAAAAAVLGEPPGPPVYCVFLPEAAFHALANERGGKPRANASVLFLDQPFERRLRLIRLALSPSARVGAVLGPDSRRHAAALRQAAAKAGLVLQLETIAEERQLIGALHRLLEDVDVLLAVPDPLVFNRHTAHSVLLTANGRGKPVSGYSRAYVQAGALLAAYSTAEQIGRQAGEALLRFLDSGRPPPSSAPRYFSVAVNDRVARSLGLDLRAEQTLADQLYATAREGSP